MAEKRTFLFGVDNGRRSAPPRRAVSRLTTARGVMQRQRPRRSAGSSYRMIKPTIISTLLMASNLALPADNDGPIVPRIAREQSIAASLRVNVNMVLVPVSVTDLYGRSVTGLQARNFRVIEGANEVPIVSFGREDQPIAVGLVFDCSRSMADKFQTAHQAPRELFQQLNPQRRELSDYRLRQSGIEERPHFRV